MKKIWGKLLIVFMILVITNCFVNFGMSSHTVMKDVQENDENEKTPLNDPEWVTAMGNCIVSITGIGVKTDMLNIGDFSFIVTWSVGAFIQLLEPTTYIDGTLGGTIEDNLHRPTSGTLVGFRGYMNVDENNVVTIIGTALFVHLIYTD